MSYLSPLRLHFFGKFQAAPSTVNNDPLHFDNANFKPSYQLPNSQTAANGWWNPMGDASWRLVGCSVTKAWMGDGNPAAIDDPITTYLLCDSDTQVAAKIVDLDPEQQMVSEIWGMQMRIATPSGETVLRGDFSVASFSDIWDRAGSGGGDIGASAVYQSVLENLTWGDISESPFLQELKAKTKDDLLSIKFNVDGYNLAYGTPEFTYGRIAGTIGPSSALEPRHFVAGRHLVATAGQGGNFFVPAGKINFCPLVVDERRRKIYVDLGNSLPTISPGGPMLSIGTLSLVCCHPNAEANRVVSDMGEISYLEGTWYRDTAGVVEHPKDRELTHQEIAILRTNPIALRLATKTSIEPQLAISESPDGVYVRADTSVLRLCPGETQGVKVHATLWGTAYGDKRIVCFFDSTQLQTQPSGLGQPPPVLKPLSALQYSSVVVTDKSGIAWLQITAKDPGTPRHFIDGQVYGIRPLLEDELGFGSNYIVNPWDFISVLVWSSFAHEEIPTWWGCIHPIFQQYANLYPVMSRFLNMADYHSVCNNSTLLREVFSLPLTDPNSMPVTRDLSPAKRQAILTWLETVGSDGRPIEGNREDGPLEMTSVASGQADVALISRGGKTVAAARRRFLQR